MKRGLLLAFVMLAAVSSGGSTAATQRTVVLKIGDAVDVAGTKVACFAMTSSGKNGMACLLWGNGKPLVQTYGVGLAVDGTAVVKKIKADGSSTDIFKRRLKRASKVYRLGVGNTFGFAINQRVALGCRVLNITNRSLAPVYRGVKVSCWRATATKPLPHTYGISISNKFAGVFAFDAKSRVGKDAIVKRQPAPPAAG